MILAPLNKKRQGMPTRGGGMPIRPRMVLMVGPRVVVNQGDSYGYTRSGRSRTANHAGRTASTPEAGEGSNPRSWRNAVSNVSMPRMPNVSLSNPFRRRGASQDNAEASSSAAPANLTPAQLEAGTRA